jgi:hypothetical protein
VTIPNTGFIISLDNATDLGDRTNWCSTRAWWTNVNIQLAGSVDATTARVGDGVTVQVRLRGMLSLLDGQEVDSAEAATALQAWVCYPNTMPGRASANLVLPSMVGSPPTLVYPADNPLYVPPPDVASPASDPGALTDWQSLGPVWQPGPQDLVPPNAATHACIIANAQGLAFWDPQNPTQTGPTENLPVGTAVDSTLAQIDICTEPHQGQVNIAVIPAPAGMIRTGGVHGFGFLAGLAGSREGGRVVLEVVPVEQTGEVDPAVLRVLRSGPYAHLALHPAVTPPRRVSLRRNPHECEGPLAALIREAEEIIEDVIEDLERLLGHHDRSRAKGTRLRLTLPPSGVQPLLFETELDHDAGPGAVHVFDLVQKTEGSGEHGGCRVALVVVP